MPNTFKGNPDQPGSITEFLLHHPLGGPIRVMLADDVRERPDLLSIGISGLMASARFAVNNRGTADGVLILAAEDLAHMGPPHYPGLD